MSALRIKQSVIKLTAAILCGFWLSVFNYVQAGVCDISGSGIGGTGAIANGSGIGGTGTPANGSGIGGTGQPAEQLTGVVIGTITGFGSICVNGIEIHYSSSTPLQINGEITSPDARLSIGQVVAVNVSGIGSEVTARDIHLLHAVSGPITAIDAQRGVIELLGQKVHFPIKPERLPGRSDAAIHASKLQPGDYIQVSGLRNPRGEIIASHFEQIKTRPTVSLTGPVTRITKDGFLIEGMKINTPPPKGLAIGQQIQVSGQLNLNNLIAEKVTIPFEQQMSASIGGLISIEGYPTLAADGSVLEVAGRIINMPDQLQKEIGRLSNEHRVIVTGRFESNNIIKVEQLVAETVNEAPEITTEKRVIPSSERHHDKPHEHAEREQKRDVEQEHPKTEHHEAIETEAPEIEEIEVPEIEEIEVPEIEEIEVPEIEDHEDH